MRVLKLYLGVRTVFMNNSNQGIPMEVVTAIEEKT